MEEEEEEPSSPSRRRLYCDCCGDRQDFDDGDDGFFYCSLFGSQSQDLIVTQTAHEDLNLEGAGIYNLHLTRSKPRNPHPNPAFFSKRDLIRALTGNIDNDEDVKKGATFGFHDDGVEEPRDFGSGSGAGPEGEALAEGIRTRYVEGPAGSAGVPVRGAGGEVWGQPGGRRNRTGALAEVRRGDWGFCGRLGREGY